MGFSTNLNKHKQELNPSERFKKEQSGWKDYQKQTISMSLGIFLSLPGKHKCLINSPNNKIILFQIDKV